MSKNESKTIEIKNFIITKNEDNTEISSKNYEWKLTLANHTETCQILNHYLTYNTKEEVSELITMIYYTTSTMLSDIKLTDIIGDYFANKLLDTSKVYKEKLESEQEEDLEIAKDFENQKGGGNEEKE